MKNPNLACDIFKILLAEYASCEGSKMETETIDELITQSFNISDQFLDRIDADPDIVAARAEAEAVKARQLAAQAHQQKAAQKPKIVTPGKP